MCQLKSLYKLLYRFAGLAICLLSGLRCSSIYELRLDVPIVMPYEYYKVSPRSAQEVQRSEPLPWYKEEDHVVWEQFVLKLYYGLPFLSESVQSIKKGKLDQAIKKLNALLTKDSFSTKTLGQIYNNLGVCYLLKKPSEIKKAKFHIDQAGILLSSPPEVMNNVRVVTYFFQNDFKIIKKK